MHVEFLRVERPYLSKDDVAVLYPQIQAKLARLPEEGRLVIDVEGVRLVGPLFVETFYNNTKKDTPLEWRFIVLKNPCDEVREIVDLVLKGTPCSVLALFTTPQFQDLVLGCSDSPYETRELIRTSGPITAREMASLFGVNQQNMRERLRVLFQRGLVTRWVEVDDTTKKIAFRYEVTPLLEALREKVAEPHA